MIAQAGSKRAARRINTPVESKGGMANECAGQKQEGHQHQIGVLAANAPIKALERFDLTPNIDDNAFLKTMSEFKIKYSWCDYFIMYSIN